MNIFKVLTAKNVYRYRRVLRLTFVYTIYRNGILNAGHIQDGLYFDTRWLCCYWKDKGASTDHRKYISSPVLLIWTTAFVWTIWAGYKYRRRTPEAGNLQRPVPASAQHPPTIRFCHGYTGTQYLRFSRKKRLSARLRRHQSTTVENTDTRHFCFNHAVTIYNNFYKPDSAGYRPLYSVQTCQLDQNIIAQRSPRFVEDGYDVVRKYSVLYVLSLGDNGCINKCCQSSSDAALRIYHELIHFCDLQKTDRALITRRKAL